MEFKFILGIDMSKAFFNYCLMNAQLEIIEEQKIDNHTDAIFTFITGLLKRYEGLKIEDIILIVEHTGIYVQNLTKCWLGKQGKLSIVPATKVSELLGGTLGWNEKTDVLDARRLAEYGVRYSDQLKPWQARPQNLALLRRLHGQRKRLNQVLNILQVPAKESLEFDTVYLSKNMKDNQAQTVKALKSDIKQIELQLKQLIMNDPQLKNLFKLITSVDGVGPVTAREVIIATEAFSKFTPDQAKSFARYSGVVPLKKESGKMKKRARTSKKANIKIKSVLTMGATSLIGSFSDLGLFYARKTQEGKPHFSVVNAMRNKLILRIFAVVRNGIIYDRNYNIC